jgi:hypothetical protein
MSLSTPLMSQCKQLVQQYLSASHGPAQRESKEMVSLQEKAAHLARFIVLASSSAGMYLRRSVSDQVDLSSCVDVVSPLFEILDQIDR